MKKHLSSLVVLILITVGVVNVFGQDDQRKQPATNYKIYTHTIVGSNGQGNNSQLPGNIAGALADIKNNFNYSNYQLLSTQFQLIKNGGNIQYKSILKSSDFTNSTDAPIFASWTYHKLNEEMIDGRKQIGFNTFRFDMRFPMKNYGVGKNGESLQTIVYESVGLTAQNVDFPVGKPVVFASLPIELNNKTFFFVVHLEELN